MDKGYIYVYIYIYKIRNGEGKALVNLSGHCREGIWSSCSRNTRKDNQDNGHGMTREGIYIYNMGGGEGGYSCEKIKLHENLKK